MLSIPLHVPTLVFALTATFLAPVAQAAVPAKPATARTLDVELVESTGKGGDQQYTFMVPIGGEIQAWVRGGDDARFCKLRAESSHGGAEVAVDLSCARNRGTHTDLEVKASRAFPLGKRVVLGRLARPDGHTMVVRATLR